MCGESIERSGVPIEKVHVIPWGIDPDVFTPEAPPLRLPTTKSFRFLFVGGTIYRKGFDRLLDAYLAEFSRDEEVCLVVKDVGNRTVYRHANYRPQVLAAQHDPRKPAVFYVDRPMTPGQLASLYTACHCLVAPYRGEGFGLPVLEGMACGLPPIVPQGGATDDFVSSEIGYLLESEEEEAPSELRLCGPLLEHSVRQEDLRQRMRQAFDEREEAREMGRAAAEFVRSRFTWAETARCMADRIHILLANNPCGSDAASSAFPRDALPSVYALVDADGDARSLARSLASVTPFVDKTFCIAECGSDTADEVAREYGAEWFRRPARRACHWNLTKRVGQNGFSIFVLVNERTRQEWSGFEPSCNRCLVTLRCGCPIVAPGGEQASNVSRQIALRLIRRLQEQTVIPTANPYGRGGDEQAHDFPVAPLELLMTTADSSALTL